MRKYYIIFAASFLVFLILLGGGYYLMHKYQSQLIDKGFEDVIQSDPELKPPDAKNETVINTLVMGIDEARSDIMIVARYNKENNQVALLSIPRDTRVSIPRHGEGKINSATSTKEGVALAMETVSNLLNIPIHHYVKIDFKGAERMVDAIGGITVNVPINMHYEDPAQNLYIDIKKGEQHLNGANAVKFIRFRSGYPDQDLGRIKAQQEFIRALAQKLTSPKMLPKILTVVDAMTKCVKTNMEQSDITNYALNIKNIKIDNLKIYTLPGKADFIKGGAYYVYDAEGIKQTITAMNSDLGIVDTALPTADGSNDASVNSGTKLNAAENKESIKDIKIEIINSAGKSGLGTSLKNVLVPKGYNIVKVAIADNLSYKNSRIINRYKDREKVEQLAKDCGISIIEDDLPLSGSTDNSDMCDITIILGKDKISGGI